MRKKVTATLLLVVGLVMGMLLSGAVIVGDPGLASAEESGGGAAGRPELLDLARDLEALFENAAATARPFVVSIQSERTVRRRVSPNSPRSPLDELLRREFPEWERRFRMPEWEEERQQRVLGSGSILDKEGHVLTNYHVVAGAERVKVKLADGRTFDAEVVGSDEKTELAVIKIEGEVKDLPTAKLGDSDKLRIGQWVLAVGNPFGLTHTVSAGIISATGRSGFGVTEYEDWIQTDAAINPGNSGGPLVNLRGEVVGINTFILSRTGGNLGIGFAVPVNMARTILDDLIEGREVVRGYLGVYIGDVTPDMAQMFDFEGPGGALVNELIPDSPAEKAGIREGDIIVEYEGRSVRNANEFRSRVAGTDPGTGARLKLWRDGREVTLPIKIGDLSVAAEAERDWLGLRVRPLTPEVTQRLGRADLEGVLVADVKPGKQIARVIRAGDIILSVNRHKVGSVREYMQKMTEIEGDDSILLHVMEGRTGRARFLFLRGLAKR